LKFKVKDCDPSTGEPDPDEEGYDDEYLLEDVELTLADYMIPSYVPDFNSSWDNDLANAEEVVETYNLTAATSIRAAVSSVLEHLGMSAVQGSDVVKDKATTHALYLVGRFSGGILALAKVRMAFDSSSGVTLRIEVRSESRDVADRIANGIA